ncbi:MAG: DUF1579 domain-containing protein [Planctomycetota bacterium]|nr:MAG: DUF1579 domain-containing protein [Planctomycetota bacterium]
MKKVILILVFFLGFTVLFSFSSYGKKNGKAPFDLKYFLGNWKVQTTYFESPFLHAGKAEGKGEFKLIWNGRVLSMKLNIRDDQGKPYFGEGKFRWNSEKQRYEVFWIDSYGNQYNLTGQWMNHPSENPHLRFTRKDKKGVVIWHYTPLSKNRFRVEVFWTPISQDRIQIKKRIQILTSVYTKKENKNKNLMDLKYFSGLWKGKGKIFPRKSRKPFQQKGTLVFQKTLQNSFWKIHYYGEGDGGAYQALGMVQWNHSLGVYLLWWFDSRGEYHLLKGRWHDNQLLFEENYYKWSFQIFNKKKFLFLIYFKQKGKGGKNWLPFLRFTFEKDENFQ